MVLVFACRGDLFMGFLLLCWGGSYLLVVTLWRSCFGVIVLGGVGV